MTWVHSFWKKHFMSLPKMSWAHPQVSPPSLADEFEAGRHYSGTWNSGKVPLAKRVQQNKQQDKSCKSSTTITHPHGPRGQFTLAKETEKNPRIIQEPNIYSNNYSIHISNIYELYVCW